MWAVLAVAWVAGLGGAAWAEDGLVVVLEPKVEGAIVAEDSKKLDVAVTEALRAAQLQQVSRTDVEAVVAGEADLQGCRTEDCQERIGRLLSGQSVVTEQVQVTPGTGPRSSWRFVVALFNVAIGATGGKETVDCENCTVDQAGQALGELVKKVVYADAAKPRGTLEVTAAIKGADVLVDGRKLGFTPFKREVFAEPHEVTISYTGHRSYHTKVVVEEGKKKAVVAGVLEKGSDKQVVVVKGSRPRWRIITGVVAMAAGLGLAGFGAYELAVNGNCTTSPCTRTVTAGMVPTEKVNDGLGAGVGAIVGGAVLIAGGAVLTALPAKSEVVQVSVGGIGTGYGLRLAGAF